MTWRKREIMEMAREAGFEGCSELTWEGVICTEELEAFAKLVREDEREACAKVCENFDFEPDGEGWTDGVEMCIQAIRARGQA
jgi:hypothetical protein